MLTLPVDIGPTRERDSLGTSQGKDRHRNRDTLGRRVETTLNLDMTRVREVNKTQGQGTTKGNRVETSQGQGLERPQVTETDSGLHIGPSLHLLTDQNLHIILPKTDKAGHPIAQMTMTGIAPTQLETLTHS
jgi:hypothetical protein